MSQEHHQLAGGITPEPPVDMLPAHIAVTKNDVDTLAELVDKGSSLVDPTSKETVLHAAVRAGAKDAVQYILREKLVSPTAMSASGHTATHYAALYHQLGILKTILKFDRELTDQLARQSDESGLSLLSLATLGGNKEMAVWLLNEYPDLANSTNSSGNYAVHFAAAQGQLEILKVIVDKWGEGMAQKPDSRQTKPVYFAAQEGRLKVLDYLINELGVDGVAREKGGLSSVHAATQGGHPTTVKWLVNKLGISYILDKTYDGATPLHMAAAQGNLEMIRFFLDHLENKDDVNVLDNINATPAHDAAEYGQTQAMILLLRAGADITIQDVENKTPYQLATEQEHQELASMLSDYRKKGLPAIAKYEKKRRHSPDESRERSKSKARTSRQEAMELSSVIQATAEVVDQIKEQNLQRQSSLQRMNEAGLDDEKEPDSGGGRGSNKARGGFSDEDNDIEHHLGPLGGIYARPNKKAGHSKTSSKHNSDIEDFIDETMSHRSYSSKPRPTAPYHLPGVEDGPYATVNHETASNISRPSRVKRYHDSDSEVSSFAGSAGHFYNSGRYPMPMGGGYGQGFPPPLPPPRGGRGGPRSVASSKQSSQYSGRRMPYGGMPYGYPPNMMGYYGYPPYGQGYPPQHYGMPMYGPPPGLYLQRHRLHHQQKSGRKASLLNKNKKKKKGRAPNYDASAEHSDTQSPRKHTDQDMGYGPALHTGPARPGDDPTFHPPAPPITHKDGTMETNEVVTHDSNFIMAKRQGGTMSRKVGETTLNPTQTQRAYDGRYDKYIMTDSESETELPDHVGVACAAEAAAIIAIGCVAGLKGLAKMRKEKPSKVGDSRHGDKTALSSAWDEAQDLGQGGKKKKHKRTSSLDDPLLKGMSPEEFASHEEWEKSEWDGTGEKKKKKKRDKGADQVTEQSSDPVEPQSELLTAELHKYASASVSKTLGEQILTSALGARHSSMLNIASSVPGSRMSLNVSSEEDDEDNFTAAISIVTGTPLKDKSRTKKKPLDLSNIGKDEDERTEEPKKDLAAKEKKKEGKKKREKDTATAEAKKREQREKELAAEEARMQEQKEKEAAAAEARKKEKQEQREKEAATAEARRQEKLEQREKEAAAAEARRQEKLEQREKEAAAAEARKREKKEQKVREKQEKAQTKKDRKAEKAASAAEKRAAIAAEKAAIAAEKAAAAAGKMAREAKAKEVVSPTTAPKSEEPAPREEKSKQPGEPVQLTPSQVQTKVEVKSADKKPQRQAPLPSASAYKQDKSSSDTSEPVEVENEVTMFDTESEDEEEQQVKPQTSAQGQSSSKSTGGFDLNAAFGLKPPPEPEPTNFIEMDDESLDIFGADGLAELNDALRELTNIQSSFSDLSSADVTMTTKQRESQRDEMSKGGGGVRKASGAGGGSKVGVAGRRGKARETHRANAQTNDHASVQMEGGTSTQTNDDASVTGTGGRTGTQTQTEGVGMATTGTGTANPSVTSTAIQGEGYSSSFEENVLRILQVLNDTMQQMRANPSITQTEIKQQELLQQQMIQNLMSYSENNPQLTSKLLSMLKREQTPTDTSDSTKNAFEMLEQKLLQAQELQSRQAQEHFRTQEQFQQAIQKKLEEQAEQQLKLMQSNFEKYSQLLNENQSRRKKKKKKKKKQSNWSDESSRSSGSDEGLVLPMKQTSVSIPAVKTMHARIYHQDLLDEDSLRTSSSTSLTDKLREKKMSRDMLRRQNTSHSFDLSQEAFKRFESVSAPLEEDDDEEGEMQFPQEMRPVTRTANIVKVRDEARAEESAQKVVVETEQQKAQIRRISAKGPPQAEKPMEKFDIKYGHHVETNEHKKHLIPEDVTMAGAGGELSKVLKLRQQQISTKHK